MIAIYGVTAMYSGEIYILEWTDIITNLFYKYMPQT